MLPVRLYLFAMTLLFLLSTLATRKIGTLEAIVIFCPLIYIILDLREELAEIKVLEDAVSRFNSARNN